jgi:hypothetical protein
MKKKIIGLTLSIVILGGTFCLDSLQKETNVAAYAGHLIGGSGGAVVGAVGGYVLSPVGSQAGAYIGAAIGSVAGPGGAILGLLAGRYLGGVVAVA